MKKTRYDTKINNETNETNMIRERTRERERERRQTILIALKRYYRTY